MNRPSVNQRIFRWGRYREVRLLGVGGESEVILAEDRILDQLVVLKWRRNRHRDADAAILETHRRLTTLAHPGLAKASDVYYEPSLGDWVLVETWDRSPDLRKSAPSLSKEVLDDVFIDLVHILDHLHATGLRHGDLKPANVLLPLRGGRRRARLIDFGMTRARDDASFPGGTPAYLPPELPRDAPSELMDWYALGLMMRELRDPMGPPDDLTRLQSACLEPDPASRRRAVREWPRPFRRGLDEELILPLSLGRIERFGPLDRICVSEGEETATFIRIEGGHGSKRGLLLRQLAQDLERRDHHVAWIEGQLESDQIFELGATACGLRWEQLRSRVEDASAGEESDSRPAALSFLSHLPADRSLFLILDPRASASRSGRELAREIRGYRESTRGMAVARIVLIATDELLAEADRRERFEPVDPKEVEEILDRVFPSTEESRSETARVLHEMTQGDLRSLESLLAEGRRAGLVEYRQQRLRIELRALTTIAARLRSEATTDGRTSPPALTASPIIDALAANFGRLDRKALAALTSLEPADLESEIEALVERGIVTKPGARHLPLALRGPHSPSSADQTWDLSLPFLDAKDAAARAKRLTARLQPWFDGDAHDAALAHLKRASVDWQHAERMFDCLESSIRIRIRDHQFKEAERLIGGLEKRGGVTEIFALRLQAEIHAARGRPDAVRANVARVIAAPSLRKPRQAVERAAASALAAYQELVCGNMGEAEALIHRGLEEDRSRGARPSRAERLQKARLLTLRGVLHTRQEKLDDAKSDYQAALALWRKLERPADLAATRANLGLLLERLGDLESAEEALTSAQRRLESAGRPDQLAASLANLGAFQDRRGRFEEAAWCHRRALVLFSLIGDRHRAGASRASVAIAELGKVPLMRSRADLEGAERILEQVGDPRTLAIVAEHLARIDLLCGRRQSFRKRLATCLESHGSDELPAALRTRLRELEKTRVWKALEGDRPSFHEEPCFVPDAEERDPIRRGLGLLVRIRDAVQDGDLTLAQSTWRHLKRSLQTWEQGMSPRQQMLFRSLAGNRAFEALKHELDGMLSRSPLRGDRHPVFVETARRLLRARDRLGVWKALIRGALDSTPSVRIAIIKAEGENAFSIEAASDGTTEKDLSRHFIHRLCRGGAPLALADAGADQQLGFADSVQRLGLLSVAGTPIGEASDRGYWLYADAPFDTAAFDEEAMARLADLSQLAGLFASMAHRRSLGESERNELREEITTRSRELATRTEELERIRERLGEGELPGRSTAVEGLNFLIRKAATSDLDLLIRGETGVGKELVAEALHARSTRRSGPFITVDLAALPESLFERELFGHEAGAFSGASESHPGLLRLASKGTLLLDGIESLSSALQAKLLRVLESKKIRPVGSTREVEIDVRIFATAKTKLRDREDFRQDLYFRIARIEIDVPPLRDRIEDLDAILQSVTRRRHQEALSFEAEAWSRLESYPWPGNIRELLNLADRLRALVPEGRRIGIEDLPAFMNEANENQPQTMDEAVKDALEKAMSWANGQKSRAAKALGISRSTLYKKLEEYGHAES